MQEGTALLVDHAQGHILVRGVRAVPQDHAAPVLSGVNALLSASKLGGHAGLVVVLDANKGVLVVAVVQQIGDIAEPKEVVVHEHGPP